MSLEAGENWLLVLPPPPNRFWLDGAPGDFRQLQSKLDAGEPWTKDEFIYYHAERGRRDLFFLAKHILGFDRLQESLHAPLAWAFQAPNGTRVRYPDGVTRTWGKFRMAEMPRGTLKTTLWTVAGTIYKILGDQDRRILIYSSNATMAQKPFSQVRQRLEGKGPNGQLFLACYGGIIPSRAEREKWSDSMLTVKRPTPYSDATLEASGIGATINGSHFTDEHVDDIVGKPETREQMQKICDTFDALTPLYDSLEDGERRFVCTPWAFYDPSVHVERSQPDALVTRRCLFETPDGTPITDPREFEEEKLIYRWKSEMPETIKEARLLKRTNSYFYSCQYECNPRDEKRIGFHKQWFRYCIRRGDVLVEMDKDGRVTEREIPIARCNTYILVDPNTGRVPGVKADPNKPAPDTTDYVGIVVVAVSPDNMWYVVEAYRERYSPFEFINKIFDLVGYWSPRSVAIEQRASQRWIRTVFQSEWRRGRPIFPIADWAGGNESKPERIRGLIPRHQEGFIFYRTQAPDYIQDGIQSVIDELCDYPNAQYDDAGDALSAGLQVCLPPGKDSPRTRVAASTEFELAMGKLDEGSARVWRKLERAKYHEGFGPGVDFWQ